jgi:drebrin-like protein
MLTCFPADGELTDLVEEFSEGRIQYAFVKVKDPNSGLPKHAFIAWCGGGVPERTKGYFTSHTAAVAKVLHGYHVQITARSDSDLEPATIMQKVADASGAKYSAGSNAVGGASAPPPIKSKPVFTPTSSNAARTDPIVAARQRRGGNADDDGWGEDAPPVSRSEIEKVQSAYKPTKVNMAELTQQKQEPSRFTASSSQQDAPSDVVRGGYQPIGKVDIAAIRAAAQKKDDDRPTPVKGAYEPVGKVDIAAIRAKAQNNPPPVEREEPQEDRPVADRAAAFSQPAQSERLTSLPKPKVANKFGGGGFSGTKAPAPGGLGFGGPSVPSAAPVGTASRTFADQGGKTPAQLWAEKKARERGSSIGETSAPAPVESQKSGGDGWKSGYSGKSWAPVQTSSAFGRSEGGQLSQDNTGEEDRDVAEPSVSAGGVSALKDRFKDTAPIGVGAAPSVPRAAEEEAAPSPPPVPDTSRPSGGFALPGLPSRPAPADEEEEDDDPSAYQPEREASPVRVAVPVARGVESTPVPREASPSPPPIPPSQIDVPKDDDLPDETEQANVARGAAEAVARQEFEPEQVTAAQSSQGGHKAIVQYDYEKAEDNEIELLEGQYVTDIDMVDEDWWLGTNSQGQRGLFPSNYVELTKDASAPAPIPAPAPAPAPVARAEPSPPPPPPAASRPGAAGPTATALYDYEAAEDNGKTHEETSS